MGSLKKNCKTPGCPNLHTNRSGYCNECMARYAATHPKTERVETRPSAYERGYDSAWRRFAHRFLINHPVCAICGAPATQVDHKSMPADVMLKVYGGKFDLEESHYQALCVSCNTRKGKTQDVRFRRKFEDDLRRLETGGGSQKNESGQATGAVRSDKRTGG